MSPAFSEFGRLEGNPQTKSFNFIIFRFKCCCIWFTLVFSKSKDDKQGFHHLTLMLTEFLSLFCPCMLKYRDIISFEHALYIDMNCEHKKCKIYGVNDKIIIFQIRLLIFYAHCNFPISEKQLQSYSLIRDFGVFRRFFETFDAKITVQMPLL